MRVSSPLQLRTRRCSAPSSTSAAVAAESRTPWHSRRGSPAAIGGPVANAEHLLFKPHAEPLQNARLDMGGRLADLLGRGASRVYDEVGMAGRDARATHP